IALAIAFQRARRGAHRARGTGTVWIGCGTAAVAKNKSTLTFFCRNVPRHISLDLGMKGLPNFARDALTLALRSPLSLSGWQSGLGFAKTISERLSAMPICLS